MPRVMAEGERGIKEIDKAIWMAGKRPFEKLVINARPAQSRFV
jgi:hypothetical protein